MTAEDCVVIVGAGHAGVQAAASLREEGYPGAVLLISEEAHLPYQRPPLSKESLKDGAHASGRVLRSALYYGKNSIELLGGTRCMRILREARKVVLASGKELEYGHLILATGSLPRKPPFPGADLDGVMSLRCLDDAEHLSKRLAVARKVVVVGAGFIGLEFAAVAAARNIDVQVVEMSGRVLGRAVSQQISDFCAGFHRALGVDVHLGVGVEAIQGENGHATGVLLTDGRIAAADLVLLAIGVVADDGLASECGLQVANGIVVDSAMTTSDADISAVGDCTSHPSARAGRHIRLESVQNATDQARTVARNLVGKPARYDALPWFWSEQGALRLQIAGLLNGCDTFLTKGDVAAQAFSVLGFTEGRLRVVESVNRPADHMYARRLLSAHLSPTLQEASDARFDLATYAKEALRSNQAPGEKDDR